MRTLLLIIACCLQTSSLLLAQQQLELRKSDSHSGYAHLTGASVRGHVSVGLPMAESVSSATMKGWIGFYPAKLPMVSSVETNEARAVRISPNPASTYCEVTSEIVAPIAVYSTLGERLPVSVLILDTVARLNVTTLAEGAYTVVVGEGPSIRTMALIVIR